MSKNRTKFFKEKLKKEILEELNKEKSSNVIPNNINELYHQNIVFPNTQSNYFSDEFFKNILKIQLGLSNNEIEKLIKEGVSFSWNKDFKYSKYKVIELDTYQKMLSSLSEAFNEGEKKEHDRHIEAEDNAFKRGEKYGREAERNKIKNELTDMIKNLIKNNLEDLPKVFLEKDNITEIVEKTLKELKENNNYLKFLKGKNSKKENINEKNIECDPKDTFETKNSKDYSSYNEEDFPKNDFLIKDLENKIKCLNALKESGLLKLLGIFKEDFI